MFPIDVYHQPDNIAYQGSLTLIMMKIPIRNRVHRRENIQYILRLLRI
jgi:hypothetical protein